MACPDRFPFSHGEKHPDPKPGLDLDPDKLKFLCFIRFAFFLSFLVCKS